MRVIDLFCGIGGVAEASRDLAEMIGSATRLDALVRIMPDVVAAIDIDRRIQPIYKTNHYVEPTIQTIESIREVPDGDMWWMSPPCQPYTSRGNGEAENDPRSLGLARIIELIDKQRPRLLILENVPEFCGSQHHHALESCLRQAGYQVRQEELCPTQWHIPMRRKRFYLRARCDDGPLRDIKFEHEMRTLAECIDESSWEDPALRVSEELLSQYRQAMHIVDANDPDAVTACFTSAYGNSPVQAGSYLRSTRHDHIRRFSPQEIGRLLGYREGFWWPEDMELRTRYQLLGNGLSVTVIRALLLSIIDPM